MPRIFIYLPLCMLCLYVLGSSSAILSFLASILLTCLVTTWIYETIMEVIDASRNSSE